jgi:hypothetical protein
MKIGYKYSGFHGELKSNANKKFQTASDFKNQFFDSCCHPIRMVPLSIRYIDKNDQIVSAVIPNMIISACGCS